jgi:hypothetical protein
MHWVLWVEGIIGILFMDFHEENANESLLHPNHWIVLIEHFPTVVLTCQTDKN